MLMILCRFEWDGKYIAVSFDCVLMMTVRTFLD